jgi:hypothetical protein
MIPPYAKVARRVWLNIRPEDQTLVRDALQALIDADLVGIATVVCEGVFAHEVPTSRTIADGALAPFVELLLRELRDIARARGWSNRLRLARAEQALTLAGFPKREPEC